MKIYLLKMIEFIFKRNVNYSLAIHLFCSLQVSVPGVVEVGDEHHEQ